MPERLLCAARGIAAAAAVLVCVLAPAQAQATGNYPRIFNSSEQRSPEIAPFHKWIGVLGRYADEQPLEYSPCDEQCVLGQWRAWLATLELMDPVAQLTEINSYMNRTPYVPDLRNWGMTDYWETPREFLSRYGDCEDYAIAKYLSLRHLGWPAEQLRIVVLQDENLRVAHAILVAYTGGAAYALDNQISSIVQTERIRHYRPIYSPTAR